MNFLNDTMSTMTSQMYNAKKRIEKMKLPVKKRDFKDKFSFTQRITESSKIIAKYPERIPVICERIGDTVPDIDRKKYLVPGDLSIANFMYVIRKRIKLSPEISIPKTHRWVNTFSVYRLFLLLASTAGKINKQL